MTRIHGVDGFQLISGVCTAITGLVMFVLGAPVGWSALILADGVAVLVGLWLINRQSRLEHAPSGPSERCTRGTRQRARRTSDDSPEQLHQGAPRTSAFTSAR